jgi:hypothetical protein
VELSARERWAIASFLKLHTDRDRAVLLSSASLSQEDLRETRDVAGLKLEVQTAPNAEGSLRQLLAGGVGLEPDLEAIGS